MAGYPNRKERLGGTRTPFRTRRREQAALGAIPHDRKGIDLRRGPDIWSFGRPRAKFSWNRKAVSSVAERCYHVAEVGGSIPSPAYQFCLARVRIRVALRRDAVDSPRYSSFVIETIVANMTVQPKADSRIQMVQAVAADPTSSPVGSRSRDSASPTYARLGWGNWFGFPSLGARN